ncbi:unnamed protein product [Schistosoma margrebowiei]|uniref:Uncharacterized protein n=1 Tax=Schistosoma margrebowiei TaxID=48269 RepID=A0A183LQ43_9TREM|nr:unnamed protein product [Schistosoma margrebowiei]
MLEKGKNSFLDTSRVVYVSRQIMEQKTVDRRGHVLLKCVTRDTIPCYTRSGKN